MQTNTARMMVAVPGSGKAGVTPVELVKLVRGDIVLETTSSDLTAKTVTAGNHPCWCNVCTIFIYYPADSYLVEAASGIYMIFRL
jgi:hypothetical protein